jgi:Holliday junction resolvasome RuvABC endonuclease subunit
VSTINLLGIDPSLTNTGYAVVAVDTKRFTIERILTVGLIETAPTKVKSVRRSSDDVSRARSIINELRQVARSCDIKIGASEVPSGAQSARAALSFGIAIGILASLPFPLIEVSPREVKLATGGTSTTDKEDIVRWATALPIIDASDWPSSKARNEWELEGGKGFISKKAEHPADAVAAVAAALKTEQFRQAIAMMESLIS